MRTTPFVLAAAALSTAAALHAQNPPAAAPALPPAIAVGQVAPDFALPGADRYGTFKEPLKLSDFHGKTVVLAFFFRARTRG